MSEHRPKPTAQSEAPPPMPEPSLQYIIQMFAIQALIWTGHIPNPAEENTEPNLDLARFQISLLEILEQKTKGNLEEAEEEFLEAMLHNTRMAFVGARERLAHEAQEEKKAPAKPDKPESADEAQESAAEEAKPKDGAA